MAIDPLTLSLITAGIGGGLSLLGGGGASFEDAIGAVANNPEFDPKIPPYPRGGFEAGGGTYNADFDRFVDFTKMPKWLEGLRAGTKGKKLSDETRRKILANPNKVLLSDLQLTKGIKQKANSKNAISNPFPTQEIKADPKSSDLFDMGQMINLNNAFNQSKINSMLSSSVVPNQLNFLNNSIGMANMMAPSMFEVDPRVQASIDKKSEDFFSRGTGQIKDAYNEITDAQDQDLILNGSYFSSDLQDLRGVANEKLSDSLVDLSLQTEALRRDDIDRTLANNRAGIGNLYGAGSFNSAISSFNLPEDNINPLFFQPFGEFGQGEVPFGQFNNAYNYATARENIRMAPLINAIAPGFQAASSPGPMQGVGSILGSLAPYILLGGKTGTTAKTGAKV